MQDDRFWEQIAAELKELLEAETIAVAIAEADGAVVYYVAAVGKYARQIQGKRGDAASSGLCGTAFNSTCPVLVAQTEGDSRVRQDFVRDWGIKTALATPLYEDSRLIGALLAFNRSDGSLFDGESERKLQDYGTKVIDRFKENVFLPPNTH